MSSWSGSTSIVIAGLLVFVFFSLFNTWLSSLSKIPSWFRFFCFHMPTYRDTFISFRSNLKPHSWSHELLYSCCSNSSCSHPVPLDCTVRDEEQSPRCLCGRMFRYLTEGSVRLGQIFQTYFKCAIIVPNSVFVRK